MHPVSLCALLVSVFNSAFADIPILESESDQAWELQALCLIAASNGSYFGSNLQNSGAMIQGSTTLFFSVNLKEPARSVFDNYLKILPEFDTDYDDSIVRVTSGWEVHGRPESFQISRTNKYVFIVDSLTLLRDVFRRISNQRFIFNPDAIFVVLYNNLLDTTDRITAHLAAERTIKYAYDKYMIFKMIFFFASSPAKLEVFIPNIFDSKTCGKVHLSWIGNCENGELSFTSEVIRRAINPKFGRNCTFKMCKRVTRPYINKDCHDGMEMGLIKDIYHKSYVKWNETCSTGTRGDLLPNSTWTGFIGNAFDSKCDVMVGGFFPDDEVNQFFALSTAYFVDSYHWYTKDEKLPEWQKIFHIFRDGTGFLIVLVLVMSSYFWYALEFWTTADIPKKDYSLALLNTVAIMTSVSIKQPKRSSFRLFSISLAIFSLVILTVFTSKLITAFKEPGKPKQIETIEEAIQRKIPVGGASEYHDWFINEKLIYDNFNTSLDFVPRRQNLDSVVRGEKIMLASISFVDNFLNRSELYALPGRVFTSPLIMIMRKAFPLKRYFRRTLIHLAECGLVNKIERDTFYNITYLENIRRRIVVKERHHVVLTTKHLSVAFTLLIAGLSLSFFVFVVEVEWDRDKQYKKKLARAKVIERKRHARRTLRTIQCRNMFKNY